MTPANQASRTNEMVENFSAVRGELKEIGKDVSSLDKRLATLENEIKHLRDDFKWIKGVLVAGVSIGLVMGLLLGAIGGVFRWPTG